MTLRNHLPIPFLAIAPVFIHEPALSFAVALVASVVIIWLLSRG